MVDTRALRCMASQLYGYNWHAMAWMPDVWSSCNQPSGVKSILTSLLTGSQAEASCVPEFDTSIDSALCSPTLHDANKTEAGQFGLLLPSGPWGVSSEW